MSIPDSFHRAKRTLLLFCAALILLGVATSPETTSIGILSISNLRIPVYTLRILLWLSTAYYFVIFVLETIAAKQTNSEPFDDGTTSMLIALEVARKEIYGNSVLGIQQRLRDFEKSYLDATTAAARERNDETKEALIQLCSATNAMNDTINNIGVKIDRSERFFTKLSPNIVMSRRISFWGMEFGGATLAFVLATLLAVDGHFALGIAHRVQVNQNVVAAYKKENSPSEESEPR